MERKLSILLVEDDKDECKQIENFINEYEDLTLIGTTDSEYEAIEITKNMLPDALILDLELHYGAGNGISYLRQLRDMNFQNRPYILITTNNTSAITYACARDLGADFILFKHQPDYSAEKVVSFLKMMKDTILGKNTVKEKAPVAESPAQKAKRIDRMITIELDRVGISPKAVGYNYLVEAIKLVIKGEVGNLCKLIGIDCSKTESSVERAMQNAINRAWRTSDIDDLLKYYTAPVRPDKGVPTMMEFIYHFARKIKNEL